MMWSFSGGGSALAPTPGRSQDPGHPVPHSQASAPLNTFSDTGANKGAVQHLNELNKYAEREEELIRNLNERNRRLRTRLDMIYDKYKTTKTRKNLLKKQSDDDKVKITVMGQSMSSSYEEFCSETERLIVDKERAASERRALSDTSDAFGKQTMILWKRLKQLRISHKSNVLKTEIAEIESSIAKMKEEIRKKSDKLLETRQLRTVLVDVSFESLKTLLKERQKLNAKIIQVKKTEDRLRKEIADLRNRAPKY